MTERTYAFLDCETTSLDRRHRQAWDIAYILRRPGRPEAEVQFFVDVDLADADANSLRIGGYYKRHPRPYRDMTIDPSTSVMSPRRAALRVAYDLNGAMLVGSSPSFDEETLSSLLRSQGLIETWHYRTIDACTFAAGAKGIAPTVGLDGMLTAFGLTYDEADRHTALGDARMTRALYDAAAQQTPGGTL